MSCTYIWRLARTRTRSLVRLASTVPIENQKVGVLLEDHSLTVPSFGGSLVVSSSCGVKVQPIGTTEHPNLDKAFVKVYGCSEDVKKQIKMDVKQEGHKIIVSSSISDCSMSADQAVCDIEIPIVHNVNVVTSRNASVECKNMVESKFCHITSEEGDVSITRLKTANLIIQTEGGNVFCNGSIQGSISIITGDGSVICDKRFIGPTLDITTDEGDITVTSCFSDHSKFQTNKGNLLLQNIHNDSYVVVHEEGNVTMQGIDGSTNVFVKKGNLNLNMNRITHESMIHVEDGDINVKVTDRYPLKVCITADKIMLDENFGKYGTVNMKEDNYEHFLGTIQPDKFSPVCQIMTEKGNVAVESQCRVASMGFKVLGRVSSPQYLNLGKNEE